MTSVWSAPVDARQPADPLDGDTSADVVVVGAGITGLWAAYYLLEADAALDVLVIDEGVAGAGIDVAGIGACTPDLAGAPDRLERAYGSDGARGLQAALRDAVVEVGGALALEEMGCGFTFGGAVRVARNAVQAERLAALVASSEAGEDGWRVLDADEAAEHITVPGMVAAAWTPDCAVLDPGRLTVALVQVLVARGARFAERTKTLRISPRAVVTDRGIVRAPHVVVTVEPGTGAGRIGPSVAALPARGLATAPLGAEAWERISLRPGVLVSDLAHLPVHARRTSDDRLVLVATGARPEALQAALVALFPPAAGGPLLAWDGRVAMARDGLPHVDLDASGIASASGLGGAGVAAANLAGRTLADLVTGADSDLTRLPWVGQDVEPWGRTASAQIALALRAAAWADSAESLGRSPRASHRVLERVPLV